MEDPEPAPAGPSSISTSRWGLLGVVRIPARYRARFEAEEIEAGRTRLTVAVFLGLILYVAYIPVVWWALPDIRVIDAVFRGLVGTPAALLTVSVIRKARSSRMQQMAAGGLALLYSAWLCVIVAVSDAPDAPLFSSTNSIIIVYVTVMMRTTIPIALALSLLMTVIQAAASATIGGYSFATYAIGLALNLSLAGSGLYALFALTNERRRSFLLSVRDKHRLREMNRRNQELDRLAETDALTGLPNRRALDRYADTHIRDGGTEILGCLLIDVDNFKPYNDNYGHPAGDRVLQHIARLIAESGTASDLACRYGGEEFAVIRAFDRIPSGAELNRWAETMRGGIEGLGISHSWNAPGHVVTTSIGVASLGVGHSVAEVVGAADKALYAAKWGGRNRVVNFSRIAVNTSSPLPRARS